MINEEKNRKIGQASESGVMKYDTVYNGPYSMVLHGNRKGQKFDLVLFGPVLAVVHLGVLCREQEGPKFSTHKRRRVLYFTVHWSPSSPP